MTVAKDEVLEHLRGELREELNTVTDNIALGGCKDFPEYQYQVGLINGIAWAERALLDLDELRHRSDDD